MKKILLIIGLFVIIISTSHNNQIKSKNVNNKNSLIFDENKERERKFNILLQSLISLESNNGRFMHDSLNHDAIGIIQIRPCMVDEVNDIVGYKRFNYSDRWDTIKSIQMFRIYQNKYNPNYDFHKGCRIWNGGPTGHKRSSTLIYLKNALIKMENIINNF